MKPSPDRDVYACIVKAERAGKGLFLSPSEVARLAADPDMLERAKPALEAEAAAEAERRLRAKRRRSAALLGPATIGRANGHAWVLRQTCYGTNSRGTPILRGRRVLVCWCGKREGEPGGQCACGGAIPSREEARMLEKI